MSESDWMLEAAPARCTCLTALVKMQTRGHRRSWRSSKLSTSIYPQSTQGMAFGGTWRKRSIERGSNRLEFGKGPRAIGTQAKHSLHCVIMSCELDQHKGITRKQRHGLLGHLVSAHHTLDPKPGQLAVSPSFERPMPQRTGSFDGHSRLHRIGYEADLVSLVV